MKSFDVLIPSSAILKMIDDILETPRANICRQAIAASLFSLLEQHGWQRQRESVEEVVRANNE